MNKQRVGRATLVLVFCLSVPLVCYSQREKHLDDLRLNARDYFAAYTFEATAPVGYENVAGMDIHLQGGLRDAYLTGIEKFGRALTSVNKDFPVGGRIVVRDRVFKDASAVHSIFYFEKATVSISGNRIAIRFQTKKVCDLSYRFVGEFTRVESEEPYVTLSGTLGTYLSERRVDEALVTLKSQPGTFLKIEGR